MEVEGEQLVVRQLVVDDSGKTHHYGWQRLEDDEGGLTDASLDVADVRPIEAVQFSEAWIRSAG